MKRQFRLLLLASCSSLLHAVPAMAQDTSGAGAASVQTPSSGQADSAAQLDEIIVTANKRNENINRVGAAISAFGAEALETRNIDTPEAVAANIPGLALAPSTHGTPVYTLRGVGYNADALGVYPAVSVYTDQAPMPFPVLAGHAVYDLERVEVLKGPQGTLFGQNSTGGAINYIAAKPTDVFGGGGSLDYGRFNELHFTGYVSGPLSDQVSARLAVDAARRDDVQRSYTRDDTLGERKYVAGRLLLDWDASDTVRFSLNVNGSIDKSDPQAPQLIAVLPTNSGAPTAAEVSTPLSPTDLRAADWSTGTERPRGDRKLFQMALRGDFDVSPNITVTSLTTFNYLKQNPSYDLDGSAFQLLGSPVDRGTIDSFNQELRLSNANQDGAAFRWTVGGNYDKSKVTEVQNITYGDNSVSNAGTLFINVSGIDSRSDIENYAVFASGEYAITPQIKLLAGARYTRSINDTRICGFSPGDGRVAQLFTILGELIGGETVPLGPNDCYPLNSAFLPGDAFNFKLDEDNVSWKVGADFQVTPGTLIYANVSRGYKAGSFPVFTASVQSVMVPARQESVTSYEAGIKARLFDGSVQANAAVFYQDYKDKQIQGTLNDPLFGLLQQLQNVPESHIYGFEADVTARPMAGLTLTGSVSYLKSEVDQYSGTDIYGAARDFAGNDLPFAPEWTLIFDADYAIPLSNDDEFFVGATVNYRTEADTYIGGGTIPFPNRADARTLSRFPFVIDGYTLVDARIGYRFPGQQLTISAWGKNIFNAFNVQNIVSYSDAIVRQVGEPATYGVTLGYKF